MDRNSLKAAFRVTLPVLFGYLAIGMAFGLMLDAIGYNVIWSFFMSLFIYAGSGQYLAVSLLATGAVLSQVALLTFIINFRHLVYGLSLLEKYRGMGLRKLYMILALTDETYALVAGVTPPEWVDQKKFYFSISVLDHLYWILGSILGSVMGALLKIDTTGVDFAMTALFITIAIDQWRSSKQHLGVFIGGGVTLLSLLIFGPESMMLPALCAIVLLMLVTKPIVERKGAE